MRLIHFFGITLLAVILIVRVPPVFSAEDVVEGEEEGTVEEEGVEAEEPAAPPPEKDAQEMTASEKDLDEEDEVKPIQPSPDAEAYMLFTKPVGTKDFPAGIIVKVLVGFRNKGEMDFIVESLDASFRYPMDYSFYIRNYTASTFTRLVQPSQEVTFDYAFYPAEDLAGRPFGLTVNLHYRDSNGTAYQNAVFNETITIVEDESGFNPETGFLYLFFGCVAVLLLLVGQHFLQKMRRKHGMTKKQPLPEMGTTNNLDVDWEWIPKEVLNHASKSPKAGSPKKSPRQRKGARRQQQASDDDEE